MSQLILGISGVKPLNFYATGGISPKYVSDVANSDNMNKSYMNWFQVRKSLFSELPSDSNLTLNTHF